VRTSAEQTIYDLSIVKKLDQYSPILLKFCAERRSIESAILTVSHQGLPLMEYRMDDCLVSSIRPGGTATDSGDAPLEEVALNFSKITWTYFDETQNPVESASFNVAAAVHLPSAEARSEDAGSRITPNTAFIMMWMDREHPELDDVSHTTKEVCGLFGIQAKRADDIEHDDRITEVILDHIRNSEFLVADLTGERPNVYYEIGFAHALGKRPILYRREGSNLHFDLSVHNVRSYRNLMELRDLLVRRFQASLGRDLPTKQ
jgi:nucleoside 2-deoxyribosyltransferase